MTHITIERALKLALEMVQTKMYAHAEMYLKEALAQPAQSAQEPEQGPVFNKLLAYVCNVPDDGIYAGELYQERHSLIDEAKAALAQPAQEPVAWMDIDEKGSASGLRYWSEPDNRNEVALYTTPPQRTWVGMMPGKNVLDFEQNHVNPEFIKGALWAESLLKELNT